MKDEEKIIELLAEMVRGQDRLVGEVSEMKNEIRNVKEEIQQMNAELQKQGLQTAENSRAILKLADEIRLVAEHEKRISKLELAVFK
jgi:Na+/phosphate symporter